MSDPNFVYTTTKTTTAIATTTLPPTLDSLAVTLGDNLIYYLDYLEKIPGGAIVLRYIKASYKNDPIRSLFEYALFVFAVHYFLTSKRKANKSEVVKLSEREIDELISEWSPAPLVDEVSEIEDWQNKATPRVTGVNGSHVQLVNLRPVDGSNVVNLASLDFLDLNRDQDLHDAAKVVINSVGVGACSPPNFYGTQDYHVRLEEDLVEYLDGEQSILYGQDFVTVSSVLPAFVKRSDVVVVDSAVSIAAQKALIVSRCDIEWYNHNDMDHLEKVLKELTPSLDKAKPLRRRFILTEGVFANNGDVADLPRIVELKNKYKYRLFLDDTLAVGVLGKTGKGTPEHFGIPRSEISVTCGSMATSFASSGGFCVGVAPMIHHQRLSSNAYVFSAALPPYSVKVVSEVIRKITSNVDSEGKSVLMNQLHDKIELAFNGISQIASKSPFVEVVSNPVSSIIHLGLEQEYRKKLALPQYYGNLSFLNTGKPNKYVNPFNEQYNLENFLLQKIVDYVLAKSNILITRSKNLLDHENLPIIRPHLLIMVNSGVSTEEYSRLFAALQDAISQVCQSVSTEAQLLSLQSEIINY